MLDASERQLPRLATAWHQNYIEEYLATITPTVVSVLFSFVFKLNNDVCNKTTDITEM